MRTLTTRNMNFQVSYFPILKFLFFNSFNMLYSLDSILTSITNLLICAFDIYFSNKLMIMPTLVYHESKTIVKAYAHRTGVSTTTSWRKT